MTAQTTTSIATFITRMLDADEAAARAAGSHGGNLKWWVDGPAENSGKWWIYSTGEKFQHEHTAAHIARHDPARVLAQVAALRAIVELHDSWPVLVESPPEFTQEGDGIDTMTMRMSKQIAWTTEQKYREHFGSEPPTAPILRALASIWADDPGWQEEWR
jgi:hypothetical protein